MKDNNRKVNKNINKYGEFVCSYHKWLSINKQKARAKYLEDISKRSNNS